MTNEQKVTEEMDLRWPYSETDSESEMQRKDDCRIAFMLGYIMRLNIEV